MIHSMQRVTDLVRSLKAKIEPSNGYQYYAGWIPRDFAEKLISSDGDFLVRKTQIKKDTQDFILSLKHLNHFHHYVIYNENSRYFIRIDGITKSSIHELVEYYVFAKQPVDPDGATLRKPFMRPDYFYKKDQIEIKKTIGKGAFGKVSHGILHADKTRECAVKVVTAESNDIERLKSERAKFGKEAEIMLKLKHPNILAAYGLLYDSDPIKLIMEYAPGGSLRSYLKKKPSEELPVNVLSKFCKDVARGLQYLALNKVIHGDIAARNCLVGQKLQLKISDFGLSYWGAKTIKVAVLDHAPLKWLAPEAATKHELSTKTDIWAYGVLLWEIFTRCRTEPYPSLTHQEALQRALHVNPPMSAPKEMPKFYATIMYRCFDMNPLSRIGADEIMRLTEEKSKRPVAWL